ncbi:hypothetical protein GCM10020254_76290 [Streptomyces goshikiensis]
MRRRVDARGPGARVLEIGAGTGATTRVVLAALAGAGPVEYVFTDLSPTFLRQGEEALRAHLPASVTLRGARFDAESDPAAQGFGADHDVVVAAGVLHGTSDVTAALRHAAALLRPGGLLLVHETTGRSDYLTLTFGLTEGWWRYQDPDLRLPHSPLLAPRQLAHGRRARRTHRRRGARRRGPRYDGPLPDHGRPACGHRSPAGRRRPPLRALGVRRSAAARPGEPRRPRPLRRVRHRLARQPLPRVPVRDRSRSAAPRPCCSST